MNVVYTGDAVEDIVRLRRHLHQLHGPQAAELWIERLLQAIDTLNTMPRRGRAIREARDLILARLYVVRYRIDEARGRVVILRIWHGRESRG